MRFRRASAAVMAALAAVTAGCTAGPAGGQPGGASGSQAVSMTFAPTTPASAGDLASAARIIRQRARELRLGGAGVHIQGQQVVVTGPAADRARLAAIAAPAVLRFRPVLLLAAAAVSIAPPVPASGSPPAPGTGTPAAPPAATPAVPPTGTPAEMGTPGAVSPGVLRLFRNLNCRDPRWRQQAGYRPPGTDPANSQIVSCSRDGSTKYALDAAKVQGSEVVAATAAPQLPGRYWLVDITFNAAGTKAFGIITTSLARYNNGGISPAPRSEVAIVLDGTVISAPFVASPVTGGQTVITGNFTRSGAQQLAAALRSGALPVGLRLVATRTTGSARASSP